MTGKEININRFKNTAFETIANKSNIVVDEKLSGIEITIFERAIQGFGYTLEDLGLKVTTDTQISNTKKAFKAADKENTELKKTYGRYLGLSKSKDIEDVITAENNASVKVETARRAFENAHGRGFFPPELVERPVFTEPRFFNKPEEYKAAVGVWAERTANAYNTYGQKTNEELNELTIAAINLNTAAILANDNVHAAELEEKMNETQGVVNNAAEKVVASNNEVSSAVSRVGKQVNSLSNQVRDAEAGLHAHMFDNDWNNERRAAGIHKHIDDATEEVKSNSNKNRQLINGNTNRQSRKIIMNDDANAEITQKEIEKYAKDIIDILMQQPTKESIALDILKSYGINIAKGALTVGQLLALGLPPVALYKILQALMQ